jgi:anthranilate phosphoribosyltransferase
VSLDFGRLLGRLVAREPIDAGDVRAAFDAILAGAWTPVQVGAFAVALSASTRAAPAATARRR